MIITVFRRHKWSNGASFLCSLGSIASRSRRKDQIDIRKDHLNSNCLRLAAIKSNNRPWKTLFANRTRKSLIEIFFSNCSVGCICEDDGGCRKSVEVNVVYEYELSERGCRAFYFRGKLEHTMTYYKVEL